MRTKEFTPIIIGYRAEEQKRYRESVEAKLSALQTFYDYVGNFISTEDRETFRADLYGTFIQRFSDRYSKDFPHISLNKIFGLMDVNMDKINSLIDTINSNDIDEEAPEPNFNIYTESEEQNKLFQYVQTIIENIENIKGQGHTIYPAPLVSAFNGALQFDFKENKLIPSIHFVKGISLRY